MTQTTLEQKETVKTDLEKTIEFSWGAVFKGWVQNLKDDVDPAIKGAKMGFFGLHAIPTWMRQHDEGKMSTEKPCLSGLLGLVVAGSSIAGYVALGKHINETTNSEWGYATIAAPVTAQGVSWAYEAFLRAKKTEMSKVVMTRLERTLHAENTQGYDLTNKQLVELLANKLYQLKEETTRERIKNIYSDIEEVRTNKELNDENKNARINLINRYESEIKSLEDDVRNYKPRSLKHARKGLFYVARNVFHGLVADGKTSKKYTMSLQFETGPAKRKRDRDAELWQPLGDEHDDDDERLAPRDVVGIISTIANETVKTKKGSANIELFGTVTSVYTHEGKEMHYEVKPNQELWQM